MQPPTLHPCVTRWEQPALLTTLAATDWDHFVGTVKGWIRDTLLYMTHTSLHPAPSLPLGVFFAPSCWCDDQLAPLDHKLKAKELTLMTKPKLQKTSHYNSKHWQWQMIKPDINSSIHHQTLLIYLNRTNFAFPAAKHNKTISTTMTDKLLSSFLHPVNHLCPENLHGWHFSVAIGRNIWRRNGGAYVRTSWRALTEKSERKDAKQKHCKTITGEDKAKASGAQLPCQMLLLGCKSSQAIRMRSSFTWSLH